jgi:hypothetical protein
MARFCDTSPCERLLEALGKWVFGRRPPQKGFMATITGPQGMQLVELHYCPFCGTRIAWTENEVLEKWLLPSRRQPPQAAQMMFECLREEQMSV